MTAPVLFPHGITIPAGYDVNCGGNVRYGGSLLPAQARSGLAQDTLQPFTIPMHDWMVHDDVRVLLPAAAATDDLGLIDPGFTTGSLSIQTGDLKAAGATTRYARAQVVVPMEYVAGQTLVLRFHAGMKTTVADVSATLDIEARKSDEKAGVGADICATDAQSINSTTMADKDFIITPAGLAPGDTLDVRMAITVNDAATGTAVIGCVGAAKRLCDVKG